MSETIQAVIATILGFSIGRAFDIWNSKKTHTLALKKEYFLKKLNAFEKATTYYTITHTSITTISMILNTLDNDDVDFPQHTVDTMLKKLNDNLETVQRSTQDAALAIELYTDFPISNENEILLSRYLEVIGQIGLKNRMFEIVNSWPEATDQESSKKDFVFDKLLQEMIMLSGELNGISVKLKHLYQGLTKQLRNEIKKYDA